MSLEPLEVTVVVDCAPSAAFKGFVERIGHWWPLSTHSVTAAYEKTTAKTVVIEPELGGRIYEVSPDGKEHVWGKVTEWQPPRALAFTWHVDSTPDLATHVAVCFAPTDDGRTGVTLTHSNWEVLPADQVQMRRDRYKNGWSKILGEGFVGFIAEHGKELG